MISTSIPQSTGPVRNRFRGLLACITLVAVFAVFALPAQADDVVHKGNAPLKLDKLPKNLQAELQKLKPEARGKALGTLKKLTIHSGDELHAEADGGINFVCPSAPKVAKAPGGQPGPPGGGGGTNTANIDVAVAPVFHSKPGASDVIYVDFNGHIIQNTAWNGSGGKSIYYARAYDIDGDDSTFNATEQAHIAQIWQRMAEDYAAFDVDVTTEPPASFNNSTARCLITANYDGAGNLMPYGNQAGGVAYVGVWGLSNFASYYSPALVYYENLGLGWPEGPSYVAEAASHEVGHNLGLSHDGLDNDPYYGGHGSGETSWGPLMGTGYDRSVSQWSNGQYRINGVADSGTNLENDLAIMAGHLGYIPDDHGNTVGSATALAATGSTTGIIGVSDSDVFAIDATAVTSVDISVAPFAVAGSDYRGNNLDVKLEVLSAAGAVLSTVAPGGDVDAAVSIPGGSVVYVRLSGSDSPNWTSYASQGQYSISSAAVGGPPPTPVAEAPVIDPNGGDFVDLVSVSLSSATAGASIYYTTDGSTPSDTNGFLYTASFPLTDTTTIKAIAIADGYDDSSVSSATFTRVAEPPPTYSIAGTVSGLGGATATVAISGGSSTNATGAYSFADLADGSYTVTPSADGFTFEPTSSTVEVAGADVTGVDFVATAVPPPAGDRTLEGRIWGAPGGVVVTFGAYSAVSTTAGNPRKNPKSDFIITGIPSGTTAEVTATLDGYVITPRFANPVTVNVDTFGADFDAVQAAAALNAPVIESLWDWPNNPKVGGTVLLQVVASDADGDGLAYTWTVTDDFGDSVAVTADGASAQFKAANAGTYTATVSVNDGSTSVEGTLTITVK